MYMNWNVVLDQTGIHRFLFLVVIFILGSSSAWAGGTNDRGSICLKTANLTFEACGKERADDFLKTQASCLNITDDEARKECMMEARDEQREAAQLCKEQLDARRDLCDKLGESAYDPRAFWSPENFVDPLQIGNTVAANPYFPLVPGQSVYESGDEEITVNVTTKTKLIEKITCLVVRDTVTIAGKTVEDTNDWYAQDINGNVWYCGEIARNYELFDGDSPQEAELVDVEGSWKAFRDYAMPGVLLEASPQPGDIYRQEMLLGDAEDVAEVLSNNADGLLAGDACAENGEAVAQYIDTVCDNNCLVTLEYSPLEPDASEHKYYAPYTGLILEVSPEGECVVPAGVI